MGTSGSKNGWSVSVIIFYFLISTPTAVLAAIFLENPALTVIIGILYLLLLGLVTLVARIGRPAFEDFIGRWSHNVRLAFSPYRKDYLNYVAARCEYFDVKSISAQGPHALKLNMVFVDLSVASNEQRFTTDPIRIPDELSTGHHPIWDYVQNPNLRNLVIIGPPGSGKTTLMRFMALTLCSPESIKHKNAPRKLPVLLYLRDHADKITEKPDISLWEVILDTLKDINVPPAGWFEKHLRNGDCLIMLDGLDEIGDEAKRKHVIEWIQDQTEQYADCRFIISSRPGGYQNNPLSRVSVLQVQPFNRQQQTQFVNYWYRANEIMSAQKDDLSVRLLAKEGAEDLLNPIHNAPALSSLAVNPLLMTMIASVHRFRSSLPGRRVELYAEICDIFLGKWRAADGIENDLTAAQKQRVLQALAYRMMCNNLREINLTQAVEVIREPLRQVSDQSLPEKFLKMIEYNSGLLIERENGEYSFVQSTFQEYLAAQFIEQQDLENILIQHVRSSWWHETIRLYCARNDATTIIQAYLNIGDLTSIVLAAQCLEEALHVETQVRNRVQEIVEEWADAPDMEKQRTAGQVLSQLRLNNLIRLDEDTYIDTRFITHVEYQLFINAMREQGKYHQPDHWQSMHYSSGEGKTPIVGVRGSDAQAFCDWLSEVEKDQNWFYRVPISGEVKQNLRIGYWVKHADQVYLELPSIKEALDIQVIQTYIDRDSDRFLKLDLKLDRNRFLKLDLVHVLTKTHARAHAPDYDLDQALASARDLDRTRMLDLDLDLARALTRAHALVRDRDINYDRVLDHKLDRAIDHILERAFDRKRSRAFELAQVLDRAIDHVLNRSIDYVVYSKSNYLHAIDINQVLYLALACALDRDINLAIASKRDLSHNRRTARFICLFTFTWMYKKIDVLKKDSRKYHSEIATLTTLADEYLDIYASLVILEERYKGNLKALEGIRIVKQRRK